MAIDWISSPVIKCRDINLDVLGGLKSVLEFFPWKIHGLSLTSVAENEPF